MVCFLSEIFDLLVLLLCDVVVFLYMVILLFVGCDKFMYVFEQVMEVDKCILLLVQKLVEIDDLYVVDFYQVGMLVQVLQLLKLFDGIIKVLVEGLLCVQVIYVDECDGLLYGQVLEIEVIDECEVCEVEVIVCLLMLLFEQYVKINCKLLLELLQMLLGIDELVCLVDIIVVYISVCLVDKQCLLEMLVVGDCLEMLVGLVDGEIDVQQMEKCIRGCVKLQMEKSQCEYYFNEQMKVIQKELGDLDDVLGELEELVCKIVEVGMLKVVEVKVCNELNKFKQMLLMLVEVVVVCNYLEWLLGVLWKKCSKVCKDLKVVQDMFDVDYYGLEKVKECIFEYLVVQLCVKQMKGLILCLVGLLGVGKILLGQLIVKVINCKFVCMLLGGVCDEVEICGYCCIYVGLMLGCIVQNFNKVGSKNLLFVFDEIDKMLMDFCGDLFLVLLEVFDLEQNNVFNDYYLEVDLDLFEVMFVVILNLFNIFGLLLDCMEVICIFGYIEDEKFNIVICYLVLKQVKVNGLQLEELEIGSDVIQDIVCYYMCELGVCNLECEIVKICCKVVKEIVLVGLQLVKVKKGVKKKVLVSVFSKNLDKYLGVCCFDFGCVEEENEIGLVIGLVWIEVGGDLLQIELMFVLGKGQLILIGQFGNVMKELVLVVLLVVCLCVVGFGIDSDFLQKYDVYLYVFDGVMLKDGLSVGVVMVILLVLMLIRVLVCVDVVMIGEIILCGCVMVIGGLKEKLLVVLCGGICMVIILEENCKDLVDILVNVICDLKIVLVKYIEEVLDLVLECLLVLKKVCKSVQCVMVCSKVKLSGNVCVKY